LLRQRLRWYTGFIVNLFRYRSLFKQKNNLGLFVLPTSLISILFALSITFLTVKPLFSNFISFLDNIFLLGFKDSFFLLFHTLRLNLFYFGSIFTIVGVVGFSMGAAILWLSKKFSRDRTKLKWNYLIYSVFYIYIYGFWWTAVLVNFLLRRKITW